MYFVKYVGRCNCEPVSVCILHELFQTDNKFRHSSKHPCTINAFPDYLCFFSKKLFNFIIFFCQSNILYKYTINALQLHIYENCSICSIIFLYFTAVTGIHLKNGKIRCAKMFQNRKKKKKTQKINVNVIHFQRNKINSRYFRAQRNP